MRESFIFYRSFYEAIKELDDKKRLKMYDSITKMALENEENENLKGICKQLFVLIKPQITANNKRYEDGKKGGRPKKEKTTGFFQKKPNENVNENENENVNENVNVNVNENENKKVFSEKKEKPDLFINPIKIFFEETYQKEFGTKPRLSQMDCNRIIELSAANSDIKELIPIAIRRLKNIEFEDINYTPTATWLLKSNNFERVINGEFERKKSQAELYRERRQLCESS